MPEFTGAQTIKNPRMQALKSKAGDLYAGGTLGSLVAAGAALTNSTTETILASHSIAAGGLTAGDVIKISGFVEATATNSTDTLQVRVRIGGVAGTLIWDSTAVDVADADTAVFDARIVIRTTGASGTLVGYGQGVLGVEGTANAVGKTIGSTAVDTTGALVVCVTGEWSVADTGNSCRADAFHVEICGAA